MLSTEQVEVWGVFRSLIPSPAPLTLQSPTSMELKTFQLNVSCSRQLRG